MKFRVVLVQGVATILVMFSPETTFLILQINPRHIDSLQKGKEYIPLIDYKASLQFLPWLLLSRFINTPRRQPPGIPSYLQHLSNYISYMQPIESFSHPTVHGISFVLLGKCWYCFLQNPGLLRVEVEHGVEKQPAHAHILAHCRLLSSRGIELGLRRASTVNQVQFCLCFSFLN